MVVFQLPEVQRQIRDLLAGMRLTLGYEVQIESRLLVVSNNFLEDIGLDMDFLINMDNAGFDKFSDIQIEQDSFNAAIPQATALPGSLGGGATPSAFSMAGSFLDNVQVDFLVRATQAHHRSRNLVSPHVTTLNAQFAEISFETETSYVASVESDVGFGIGLYNPIVDVDVSGIQLYVTPVITEDKRHVLLQVEFSQQITREFANYTYVESSTQGTQGVDEQGTEITTPTVTIQQPQKDVNYIRTNVSVPDGGTLLLGGQKLVAEIETESGVPALSKIPFLSRLFSNRSKVKDETVLIILIKPTIILPAEREEIRFGNLLEN